MWETRCQVVARKQVVQLEVEGPPDDDGLVERFQGTGFLIAEDKLVTALHVVAELDEKGRVLTELGRALPLGPITCRYFSEEKGYWTEVVEFDPLNDPFDVDDDWVVLRVGNAPADAVWKCDEGRPSDRGGRSSGFGFPQACGVIGTPLHGDLTGIGDPYPVESSYVFAHRAWLEELGGKTALSPEGCSGGPVVMGDRVLGLVRSYFDAAYNPATGKVVPESPVAGLAAGSNAFIVPIERVLDEVGIEISRRRALFEGPLKAPARPVRYFRGRDNELDELKQLLRGDNTTVCVVATGIGGIGKTILVQQFVATRAQGLFPDGAAWLDGGQLVAELGRVSRRFGWAEDRAPTPAEAVSLLGRVLDTKRFLLVVDNFDPQHSDPKHVPAPGGLCRVLVTSRARAVHVRLDANRLELGVWAIKVCREYLRERCPRLVSEMDADVDRLAEFVGRLPLGARLLVSMLGHRQSLGADGALKLLEKQQLGALDKYAQDRGIASAFQFSYDGLTDKQRDAFGALAACAEQTRAEIVEAVAGVGDISELLDDLHERGLAEFTADAAAPWGLHDVVRMFLLTQPGCEEFEVAHTDWVRAHMREHADETAFREFGAGVDEARRAFERLLGTDLEQAASFCWTLQDHLTIGGRYSEAIELGESLYQAVSSDSALAANARTYQGICYLLLGDILKAIESHEHALAVERELGNLQGQASALGNLGNCYAEQGDILKAIEFHKRSFAIEKRLDNLQGQADALGNLGNCYRTRGDIPRAIEFFEGSLAISERLGRLRVQANALGNLGLCYGVQGDLPKAIELHERALVIDKKVGNLDGQVKTLGNLGICCQTLGEFSQAVEFFERSLVIAAGLNSLDGRTNALGNLGNCYRRQGDITKAIAFLIRGLAISEQMGNLQSQTRALGNLGNCYLQQGDVTKAFDFAKRALAINEKVGNLMVEATTLGDVGLCYLQQGDILKAIEFLERSLAVSKRLGYLEGQAGALSNLGVCYKVQGNISKAIGLQERSLATAQKADSLQGQANALAMLGLLSVEREHRTQARGYLSRARRLFLHMGFSDNHPHLANVNRALATLGPGRGLAPGSVQGSDDAGDIADLGDMAEVKRVNKRSGRRKRRKKP